MFKYFKTFRYNENDNSRSKYNARKHSNHNNSTNKFRNMHVSKLLHMPNGEGQLFANLQKKRHKNKYDMSQKRMNY